MRRVDPDFLIPATDHHIVPQLPAQKAHCLPERPASVLLIVLRPQQRGDLITAAKGASRGEDQVQQEGQPLGLTEDGALFGAAAGAQVEMAQDRELEPGLAGGSRRRVHGGLTLAHDQIAFRSRNGSSVGMYRRSQPTST
jgi:hypothetical protein